MLQQSKYSESKLMKYAIFILFYICISVKVINAQTSTVFINGKKYESQDTSFHYSAAIEEIFLENNGQIFWNFRKEFKLFVDIFFLNQL